MGPAGIADLLSKSGALGGAALAITGMLALFGFYRSAMNDRVQDAKDRIGELRGQLAAAQAQLEAKTDRLLITTERLLAVTSNQEKK
jgi:hypothetical protein